MFIFRLLGLKLISKFRYAVIATACAACPELRCERPGCGALFCYHCKGPWHASQTCDEARKERGEIYRRSVPQLSAAQESILKRTFLMLWKLTLKIHSKSLHPVVRYFRIRHTIIIKMPFVRAFLIFIEQVYFIFIV